MYTISIMRLISFLQFLLVLFIFLILPPLLAQAKGDECINEHNSNQRAFCLATQYANGTACDSITSLDLRSQCISTVKNKQRAVVWKFTTIDTSTADVRGDRKYIWQH